MAEADRIQVKLADGRRFEGRLVGKDERVDLALVKIEATGLPVAALGDSNRIRVGEFVLALGQPFGLEQSVSFGIVSRKGAPLLAAAPGFDFIQTDATVNPGNSGGPLVNMAGEVIGINSMAARNGTIGFAIPINLVKGLLPQLASKGKVEWGWLGVGIADVGDDDLPKYQLKEARGVLIRHVVAGQPADKGGLKADDVVLAVDGTQVESMRDLQRIIASTPVGRSVKLFVMRGGKEQELEVVVGPYQTAAPAPRPTQPRKSPEAPAPKPRLPLRSDRAAGPLAAVFSLLLVSVAPAEATEVRMLFPTDQLTEADPRQLTGRRVHLSLVNCVEAPSTCDEISLLNGLDGWSVNPRMTLAFTGRVALDSITRSSVFVLPLGNDASEPVGLSRLVWDPEGRTLYATPERVLRQGQLHALVVTSRVQDDHGRPLRPAKGVLAAVDARPRRSGFGASDSLRATSARCPCSPRVGHGRARADARPDRSASRVSGGLHPLRAEPVACSRVPPSRAWCSPVRSPPAAPNASPGPRRSSSTWPRPPRSPPSRSAPSTARRFSRARATSLARPAPRRPRSWATSASRPCSSFPKARCRPQAGPSSCSATALATTRT